MVFYNFPQSFRNYTAKLKRSKNQKSDIYHVFLFKKDAYKSTTFLQFYEGLFNLSKYKQKVTPVTFYKGFTFLLFFKYLIFAKNYNI
jgi:hypothetical protein